MKKNINLFGQASSYKESDLILLPVPWSATVSFGEGAHRGPELIRLASSQMDFFSKETGDIRSKRGIHLLPSPLFLEKLNQKTRKQALPLIEMEEFAPGDFPQKRLNQINRSCAQMVEWVYEETRKIHESGKQFGLLGGDHSTSEGALRYLCEIYKGELGILHLDAHADLRKSYQGLKHSHASVMYNVIHQESPPSTLVQVGVRDYCEEEYQLIEQNKNIHVFFDSDIKTQLFEGETWKSIVDHIIQKLPEQIYISLDVDGLKPHLFPNTGTPVPGGLSFEQTSYLLRRVAQSGRQIRGFDLVEVADKKRLCLSSWDAQVGARILLQLCSL